MSNYIVKTGRLYADDVRWRSIDGTVEDLVDGGYDITIKPQDIVTKGPYIDVRAYGAVGNGISDDYQAIQDAVDAQLGPVFFPKGTYMISQTVLADSSTCMFLGCGPHSVIKAMRNSTSGIIGASESATQRSKLWIKDLVLDGNNDNLAAFTEFEGSTFGHGLTLKNWDEVFIDDVIVQNTTGHGVFIMECSYVQIGSIMVRNCDGYGFVYELPRVDGSGARSIEANKNMHTLQVGQVIVEGCGTQGTGWSGLNVFDSHPAQSSYVRRLQFGLIHCKNGGRSGATFGRNADGSVGLIGGTEIQVDSMILQDNEAHGTEIYGAKNFMCNQIYARGNGRTGITINVGDDLDVFSQQISIGQIQTIENGYYGLHMPANMDVQIGRVLAVNNSQSTASIYDGVSIYSGATGAIDDSAATKNIHIGSILAFDDQDTPTQRYGVNYYGGTVAGGHNRIEYIRAYDNATADVHSVCGVASYSTLDVGSVDVGTFGLTYSFNEDGANSKTPRWKIGGWYYFWARTTDGAANYSLGRIPIPDSTMGIVEIHCTCHEDGDIASGDRAIWKILYGVLNTAAATAAVSNSRNWNISNYTEDKAFDCDGGLTTDQVCDSLATKIYYDGEASYIYQYVAKSDVNLNLIVTAGGAGADYITPQGTGLAGKTINWFIKARYLVEDMTTS